MWVQLSVEFIRFSGAGVTDGCKRWVFELILCPLPEQYVSLTTEPSLCPLPCLLNGSIVFSYKLRIQTAKWQNKVFFFLATTVYPAICPDFWTFWERQNSWELVISCRGTVQWHLNLFSSGKGPRRKALAESTWWPYCFGSARVLVKLSKCRALKVSQKSCSSSDFLFELLLAGTSGLKKITGGKCFCSWGKRPSSGVICCAY